MYDEIYNSWLNVKSKNNENELNEVKNKILEYLNRLQNTATVKHGVLRKICEAKIANLKLIMESLEGDPNHKLETSLTPVNNEKNMIPSTATSERKIEGETSKPKYLIIRLLQSIPTIVGSDLENYGPFNAEDIATLPVKNALALIKRNAAVEINWGGRNENG
ncbi:MAG: hypothetical protein OdinLCB4_003895 [Candidatus Odinarchaeum yellowstonii]|uniref:Gins51 C-terminal domain-containing protein n=1 Tax=Odinarchaeota yellowstonii (strain LCB_4) TaxID=1841599 RepID=A0AAF0D0X8_ODILC|nr:MAG: hypothetical protein OdinLCB4_003895 [Candidatus Odinarchaeum yellowstonii]